MTGSSTGIQFLYTVLQVESCDCIFGDYDGLRRLGSSKGSSSTHHDVVKKLKCTKMKQMKGDKLTPIFCSLKKSQILEEGVSLRCGLITLF